MSATGASPGAPPEAEPVCPRHPDRVSYVRCQRCERPACPACQRPAAVGVHCVDCVRSAARSAPVARTLVGAPVRSGPPVVTAAVGVVALLGLLLPALWPGAGRLVLVPGLVDVEPWRMLTLVLVGPGILGLVLVAVVLSVAGRSLEERLGPARLATVVVVAVLAGSVVATLVMPSSARLAGLSAAITGILAASAALHLRAGRSAQWELVLLGVVVASGLLLGAGTWALHVGGAMAGAALGAAYAWAPRDRRRLVAVAAPAVLVALLAVVLLVTVLA